jgi:D-alanyl-lipoteichoic acid acyltransferase DltB (MBOAT superfamily)
LFLPLVTAGFYLLPHKFRWPLVLLASYIFYGWWRWEFLIIIAFSTLLDYFCALKIEASSQKRTRKTFLIVSVVANLSILFIFKYFYFFIGSTEWMQAYAHNHQTTKQLIDFLSMALPVGISFYTFQTMSYTIDVYNRNAVAEKHLGHFAVFVSYFPQLVAGPIERFTHLNEQLKRKVSLTLPNLQAGFRLMIFGFFVKMVIADNLSYTVSSVFDNPSKWYFYWDIIGVLAFCFQIYADFFGYSLIAQGVAKIFGVDLMDNFNKPYLADGINDFWKKWHISLSTWFRDYLYIPLGGNRVKNARWIFNIFAVFVLSGLWHGANYTFIIWGAMHGVFYLIERFSPLKVNNSWLKRSLTFFAVAFAWIFFRAKNFDEAGNVIQGVLGLADGDRNLDTQPFIFFLLLIFAAFELHRGKLRFDDYCAQFNTTQRWAIYAFLLFCILTLSGSEYQPFIYFRF